MRVTRKWIDARIARLARAIGRSDLELEIWGGGDRNGKRYQVKTHGGSRDLSPVLSIGGLDTWLDGAIAIADLSEARQDATWTLEPGRVIARDGQRVACLQRAATDGRPADTPHEIDELAHALVRALNGHAGVHLSRPCDECGAERRATDGLIGWYHRSGCSSRLAPPRRDES